MTGSFEEVQNISRIMSGFENPWFIAGGWAIDLFIEHVTRNHMDIEVAILRCDQLAIQSYLENWKFKKVIPDTGDIEPWEKGEYLELPIHEIHARNVDCESSTFEILLNESHEDKWIFRRNPKISRPLLILGLHSKLCIPFLSPEIVLLYKAKNLTIQDEADFNNVRELLSEKSRKWLKKSIKICNPGHPWIDIL